MPGLIQFLRDNEIRQSVVVCDESHRLRNEGTLAYRGAEDLLETAAAVIFLTATPVMIKEENLYNQMHLLCPGKWFYRFTDCKTVSELIDHSKLYVKGGTFPVLATAFALSHSSLQGGTGEPDAIDLAPLERLFDGVRLPKLPAVMTRRFRTR